MYLKIRLSRRTKILVCSLFLIFCVILLVNRDNCGNVTENTFGTKIEVSLLGLRNSKNNLPSADRNISPACKLPVLDVSNSETMRFFYNVSPLKCSPKDWVKAEKSRLYIDSNIINQYGGSITCTFKEILRINDFDFKWSPPVETDSFYVLQKSDYAEIKCDSATGHRWRNAIAAVKEDPMSNLKWNWAKVPPEVIKLNVLIFGFDSLSRKTFERKLPRSYQYMRQKLDSLVLEGYSVIDDSEAIIPILTGKIESELPDRSKKISYSNSADIYPTIWKDYKKAGFITGFMEDLVNVSTFSHKLSGFDEQPTDHYMRSFYLAATPYFDYSEPFCLGDKPRHLIMMEHIKTIFNQYKDQPKFVFGFHRELSHNSYNNIGLADDDVSNWLKELKELGHLDNTILIFMSNHGHRFGDFRDTIQGKQEERLPFCSFTFPSRFKKEHPLAYANFVLNTQILTTPYDIHATLKHSLNFRVPTEGDLRNRGISLFDKIPIGRSCFDAFIEPDKCNCLP